MSAEAEWSLATSVDEDNGNILIMRIRDTPPEFASPDLFPKLLDIVWEFDGSCNNGMPLLNDLERMQTLEDRLEPALEGNQQAFLAVVVTGKGVREWQWYVKEPTEVMKLVNQTLSEIDPFPVKFIFQEDSTWETYSRFRAIPAQEAEPLQKKDDWEGNGDGI